MVLILLGILLSFLDRTAAAAWNPHTVMIKVAERFGMQGLICQERMGFNNGFVEKMRHFWHEDFDGTPEETACPLQCVLRGLHLIDERGNIQHTLVSAFIRSNGADEDMSKRLMAAVTEECPENNPAVRERTHIPGVPGQCLAALTLGSCLRKSVLDMDLKPIGEDDRYRSGNPYYY